MTCLIKQLGLVVTFYGESILANCENETLWLAERKTANRATFELFRSSHQRWIYLLIPLSENSCKIPQITYF